jgi:hypothetical protein
VTAAADPLLRHVYGLDAHWGERTAQASWQGFYQYDRFRPTFLLTAGDTRKPALVQAGEAVVRERQVTVRATLPVWRRIRSTQSDTLALRLGGGTTFGRPSFRRSFSVGGFPDGSLFDVVGTNHSVLRGYPQDGGARVAEFSGRRFAHANAEYRFPLLYPQHGWRTLPLFVRHLHASVFADVAHAWTQQFRLGDVRTGAGVALGADVFVGHGLPLTTTAGVARGFATGGETRFYLLAGLAF